MNLAWAVPRALQGNRRVERLPKDMTAHSGRPSRRTVLGYLAAAAAGQAVGWPALAAAKDAPPIALSGAFTRSTVTEIARRLAKAPYVPPPEDLPAGLAKLTYDQYRAIYFRPEAAVWAKDNLPFRLQFFHRGFFYKQRIDVSVVKDGEANPVAYSPSMFQTDAIVPTPLPTEDIGFAGLRLHGHINRPDYFDEIAAFQGASYFRSLGKDQIYGLSARGLALNVGAPEGEEFPLFRDFWAETPAADSNAVVIHALLDSKSVSGAYRFTIRPGMPTEMDVEATLFPRVDLKSVGLAPATSMFYFDANGRDNFDDWRPQVHDSDGLLIINGRGERLWRPLANPGTLQFSAFVDNGTRGFGLLQRNRNYDSYNDYTTSYEKRPSLWVEPVGDWGKGSVVLVEIPSQSEINDNIVAYWQPAEPIPAGSEYAFSYHLAWGDGPALPGLIVSQTSRGRGDLRSASPVRRFVVDFTATGAATAPDGAATASAQPPADPHAQPKATVTASAGAVNDVLIEKNPENGGWRLTFNLDPAGEKLIELRAVLAFPDSRPVDTWLYRWTA